MKNESDCDTDFIWSARYSHQRFETRTRVLRIKKKTSTGYSRYNLVEIGQDTKKSPGNLMRLTGNQISVINLHVGLQ